MDRKAAAAGARAARREAWERAFSPGALALAGAALSVSLLLMPSPLARGATLAAAAVAAWASGRKLSPVLTATVMAGIVGANLLVPLGRKLYVWGPVVVTEIALREGIMKAVTFEALVFISKACLGSRLRLPGGLGRLFASALRSYDRILAYKGKIRPATFIADIDQALIAVYAETGDTIGAETAGGRRPGDPWLITPVLAALAAALLIR